VLILSASFLLTLTIALGLQVYWVNRLIIGQSTERLKINIQSAWNVLDQQRIALQTLVVLEDPEALRVGEPRAVPYADLFEVVDAPRAETLGLPYREVVAALKESPVVSGYFIADFDVIPEAVRDRAADCAGVHPQQALLLFAAAPAADAPEGSIRLAAKVLNCANALVDKIENSLFASGLYEGHRLGTATIFLGGQRVATSVKLDNGPRAIGTQVSREVAEQVLERGAPWTGRAWVVNAWYISRYDPIVDLAGKVIGMLYIGELEQPFRDLRRETVLINALALTAVFAVIYLLVFLTLDQILARLRKVRESTERFAEGDYSARAAVEGADEIRDVAGAFNLMAERLAADRRELLARTEEAEQANENYLDMLSMVSHEFRSTLASALFNVQLFQEGSYGVLDGEQREGMDLIAASLGYLEEITETYLQLSRIERGELAIQRQSVPLRRDVIEPVLQRARPTASAQGVRIHNDVPEELRVLGDPNLLRGVFENLVSNALKYGREEGEIRLGAHWLPENMCELSVFNLGPGVARKDLPQLFQKFHRLDAERPNTQRGTGLGLFIVKEIVDRHGGVIHAESEPGESMCFILTLPTPEQSSLH